jgi:hypothetical protein
MTPNQINNIIININNGPGVDNNNIQVEIQNDRVEVARKENNVLDVNQKKLYVTLSRLYNSNTILILYTLFVVISLVLLSCGMGALIMQQRLYFIYILGSVPLTLMLTDVYVRIYLSVSIIYIG